MSGQSHSVIVHHLTKTEKTKCICIALAILFSFVSVSLYLQYHCERQSKLMCVFIKTIIEYM